jgi:hypothetical protein
MGRLLFQLYHRSVLTNKLLANHKSNICCCGITGRSLFLHRRQNRRRWRWRGYGIRSGSIIHSEKVHRQLRLLQLLRLLFAQGGCSSLASLLLLVLYLELSTLGQSCFGNFRSAIPTMNSRTSIFMPTSSTSEDSLVRFQHSGIKNTDNTFTSNDTSKHVPSNNIQKIVGIVLLSVLVAPAHDRAA